MKITIKAFVCHYKKFGESKVDMNEFKKKYKNKCYINQKVIHHNHSKKFNNIIDYICNNCNLKIKNTKELVILFHDSKGYDNTYMIDIFSKIENVEINCLTENQERFRMLNFRIPNKQYNIKIIDSLSFLQGKLEDLSKELIDNFKIVTKNHFQDKFEFVIKKLENFPYDYLNPNNLDEKILPEKKYFDNVLTMKSISEKEYENVKLFYKKMKFKNLKQYLECYLISDILLLSDYFNHFRKIMFEEFQLDTVKCIISKFIQRLCIKVLKI